ncbi:MAG: copper homeostasis protein CutC [Bacteroidales bacterium]|nr:copper homeostasis protein CutC [Bacteroidales bacterium]
MDRSENVLEIAVFSLEAAILAGKSGADRIELCSAPAEGGLTPSIATIRLAKQLLQIPVHVMIRPREGDFCYSDFEFENILLDIEAALDAGADGIVCGILLKDGQIDEQRMKLVRDLSYPRKLVFHRAFDMSNDLFNSMDSLIKTGIDIILTSGGKQTALEGVTILKKLVQKAQNRIKILPGSGISLDNAEYILKESGANSIHLSAKRLYPGKMVYKNENVRMGGTFNIPEYDLLLPEEEAIKKIKNLINSI